MLLDVLGDNQAAHRVPEQEQRRRQLAGRVVDDKREVVQVAVKALHVHPRATRTAMTARVKGRHREPVRQQRVDQMAIAAAVLSKAVVHQQRALGTVGHPSARLQLQAV